MIIVHHLEYSRSTRVLWLLEELGEPYDMRRYARDPKTFRAPPELKAALPLGKAPAIEVDGRTVAESGAILEYLAATLGGGRLARGPADPDWPSYLEWLHAAEGSTMLGIIVTMIAGREGSRIAAYGREVAEDGMASLERALADREHLLGGFSAADIQNAYVAASADRFGLLEGRPAVRAWLDRLFARPAYARAIEKGGPMLMPVRS